MESWEEEDEPDVEVIDLIEDDLRTVVNKYFYGKNYEKHLRYLAEIVYNSENMFYGDEIALNSFYKPHLEEEEMVRLLLDYAEYGILLAGDEGCPPEDAERAIKLSETYYRRALRSTSDKKLKAEIEVHKGMVEEYVDIIFTYNKMIFTDLTSYEEQADKHNDKYPKYKKRLRQCIQEFRQLSNSAPDYTKKKKALKKEIMEIYKKTDLIRNRTKDKLDFIQKCNRHKEKLEGYLLALSRLDPAGESYEEQRYGLMFDIIAFGRRYNFSNNFIINKVNRVLKGKKEYNLGPYFNELKQSSTEEEIKRAKDKILSMGRKYNIKEKNLRYRMYNVLSIKKDCLGSRAAGSAGRDSAGESSL